MTFSLVGRCEKTNMLGVVITTSSICVGSRCPWVRSNIGAVATQNVTLPAIGSMVLDKITDGLTAQNALDNVLNRLTDIEYRQVAVIDRKGGTAGFSGKKMLGINAIATGKQCIAAGNLLKSDLLPSVMVKSFEENKEKHLAERLLACIEAGLYEGGGEVGSVHSAALVVAYEQSWPLVDLRCDWDDENPIKALRNLWMKYAPQMYDYVTRALDPKSAPSYGVPGDE